MAKTKKVNPTKVEVMDSKAKTEETKEEKPDLLKRSLSSGKRCCTALQSIFASIGSMIMGKRKPHWLAKLTAGFLTVLGWLFFSVAFTPALASGLCEIGTERLMQTDEVVEQQEDVCSEKSTTP